jgi:hypothetical protein
MVLEVAPCAGRAVLLDGKPGIDRLDHAVGLLELVLPGFAGQLELPPVGVILRA